MKISTEVLLEALKITKPGISNKNIVDQSDCYVLKDGKIFTFNDQICISHPIDGLDIEGAVFAEQFYEYLSTVIDDEIELYRDKDKLVVKTEKSKAEFVLNNIRIPIERIGKPGKWYNLTNFSEALQFVVPYASKDISLPIFNSINIDNRGWIESTDGYRIMRYYIDIPIGKVLIPLKSARIVIKIKPLSIAQTEGWIHFLNDNDTIISCRVYTERFPDSNKVLEKPEGFSVTFPEGIEKVIERSNIFLRPFSFNEQSVIVNISGNVIKLTAKTDTGCYTEKLEINYNYQDIEFFVTPKLLKNIFQIKKQATLNQDLTRIYFEDNNWSCVVVLRGGE